MDLKSYYYIQIICRHITSDKYLCRNAKHIYTSMFFSQKKTHKTVPSFVFIYAFIKSECLAPWKYFVMETA